LRRVRDAGRSSGVEDGQVEVMARTFETREILADTRGYSRRVKDGRMRSHAVEIVDGVEARVLCERVKVDNLADAGAGDVDAVPSCDVCARRLKAARKAETDRKLLESMRQIETARVALGQCRHCGGAVPCWSGFGDAAVGVKHTRATLRAKVEQERRDIIRGRKQ
jgi:hypothetical protein